MKKLAKGAVALGVGTALLLGGAGTFAYWNQSVASGAGTVTAGNLELTVGEGTWTDRDGQPIDISTYRIVPGEELYFKQKLDVKIEGDNLAAKLENNFSASGGISGGRGTIWASSRERSIYYKQEDGTDVPNPLTASTKNIVSTLVFKFKSTVTGRDNVNNQLRNTQIHHHLVQVPRP